MNWYKTAKLADKIHQTPNEAMFVRCMHCKKFLTDPEGIYSEEEKRNIANWKAPEEMDAEELRDWDIAVRSKFDDPIGVSDGYCPVCYKDILNKYPQYFQKLIQQTPASDFVPA